MDSSKRPPISFSWREGRYLDCWSVVHLLTGVTLALLAYLTPLGFSSAIVLAIAGYILYEWLEAVLGIGEVLENRVSDVVVATIGFVAMYRFAEVNFTDGQTTVAFAILFPALGMLAFLGWRAWRQRQLTG